LALRAKTGESLQELVDWWQAFQDGNKVERQSMVESLKRG